MKPLIYIRFNDHVQGSGENVNSPIECEIVGILRNEDDTAYYVATWIANGDLYNNNSEIWCILKGVVLEFKQLKVSSSKRRNDDSRKQKSNQGSKGRTKVYGRRIRLSQQARRQLGL